ncbi:MAG TPA: VOC family protein [Bryobacteraceae bacterium]|jgi:catechol 2,3-dioxygenase-like lactoylglutathione lyase family enzyme|nr:VOC family protein [Bryobacteraceae bacterium]
MTLNHIDLQVSNIDDARKFFENFFGLRCTYRRGGQIAFLVDDGGFELGLSNLHNSPPPVYPREFHIGFIQDNLDTVREIYERLKDAGVPIKFELQEAGPNLAFQCVAPDSIVVEVRAPRAKA